jgi:hydrogenase expression/formation protein HypD
MMPERRDPARAALTEDFRDPVTCRATAEAIAREAKRPIALMEVCGGHTVAIHRNGLRAMLPPNVRLL